MVDNYPSRCYLFSEAFGLEKENSKMKPWCWDIDGGSGDADMMMVVMLAMVKMTSDQSS